MTYHSYLFERCTLKLGLRINTIRSIVFNVDPIMKITPQVITKIKNEVSYSSNPLSLSIFVVLFAMFNNHKSFQ